jgi:CHAD domain-containing protein
VTATTDLENGAPPTESVFIGPEQLSGETITRSLQALMPARHRLIPRHRFTVFDTFDGRIQRAGAFLTIDTENGTCKAAWRSHGGDTRLTVRLTDPVSFAWDFPDGPFQQLLSSVVGPRRLLAQADVEEQGSLLEILDDRRKTVARLRITSGQAKLSSAASAWTRLPTLVTLTGLRGYGEAYKRLVPVIVSRPGLEPSSDSSLDVMLKRVGAPTHGDVSLPRVNLSRTVRADIGARQIHLALLDILHANEPGLRANIDTEFLHDFRVAVRRTRSLLGQIRQVFPQDTVEHFSTEFSWLGRLTGPPRDLDVLVLTLRQRRGELSAADCDALMTVLSQAQQQAHSQLVEALDSTRYRRLLSDWRSFLERPLPSKPDAVKARGRLAALVSRRAWRLSKRIVSKGKTVGAHTPAEEIHALRIDAKKLRYLIDVAPAFFDRSDAGCVLSALKKLQRVLGDFNDADVQERRLLECGRALGSDTPASVLMMLGRLVEQCRQRRERLRPEVLERLTMFRARETRSACRRAFKSAQRTKGAR